MTAKPSLLVTRKLPDPVLERAARDYEARLNAEDKLYGSDEMIERAQGCAAILTCSTEKFTAEVIARLPASVRAVATFSVGTEHMDLEAARARGLVVTNTPDVLTDSTADITLLVLLGAARRAYEGQRMVREDKWFGWTPTQLLGVQVSGKRLGILGMGRIGLAVAKRARGFDMEIHYHNRNRLAPEIERGARYHAQAEAMLGHCDFLSINCPATPETHHFLDARRIALLPERAIVTNTARGAIVDDEALIAALKSGRLAAAGLDVFEGEPDIHPGYRDLPNVFILPHMGSATLETRNAMGFKCLDNLDAHFAGAEPPDRVA
ncbi:MAG: D-glycerate dehydrogenase [Proteobacteria bacterium]|nr:D-glycerate dehydrogenase [Pseudomonadota bacterium]